MLTIGCHWPALSLVPWWPSRQHFTSTGPNPARVATPASWAPASASSSADQQRNPLPDESAPPRPTNKSSQASTPFDAPGVGQETGPTPAPGPAKFADVPGLSQATPVGSNAPANSNDIHELDQFVRQAQHRYTAIQDYVCRFRRREVLANGQVSEDLLLLRFRKQPLSIHLLWPKGTSEEGREVVYVQGRFNNQLVIRTGRGDLWPGIRVQLALDSPRATANTRRCFLEMGVGYLVESLGQVLHEQRQSTYRFGRLRYVGRRQRPESPVPMECLVQEIPPGLEKYLPRGGKRHFFIATDPRLQECHLPVLVVTHDDTDREVEYYCYDRFNINIGLGDEDFDPDRLWTKK